MGGFFSPGAGADARDGVASHGADRDAGPDDCRLRQIKRHEKAARLARGGGNLRCQQPSYHMMTRSFGGRYILSPGFTSKA